MAADTSKMIISFAIKNFDKYAKLNEERLKRPENCDIGITMRDGMKYSCHKEVLIKSFDHFKMEFDEEKKSASYSIHVLVHTSEVMDQILNMAYTGQLVVCNENIYDVLQDCSLLEFKYLEELCEGIFSKYAITSRLFDIFDLFNHAHFKSAMWYSVLKYIARVFQDVSQLEEYLEAPYEKIRPRCTTLFRYLPAYMDKEDHILDYFMRWVNYDYEERKIYIPRLLEKIPIRDVSGTFAKQLIVKLFDSDASCSVVAHTKRLRTFVRMEKNSHFFLFEYELQKNGMWNYVNSEAGERTQNSRFVVVEDRVFNLRTVLEDNKRRYIFRSSSVDNHENLIKIDPYNTTKLKIPPFTTDLHSFDLAPIESQIYVYVPTEKQSEKKSTKQMHFYDCVKDDWYDVGCGNQKSIVKSCLVSYENTLYLIGGQSPTSKKAKGYFYSVDRREGKFNKLPASKHVHVNGAACVADGKIYMAGGQDECEKAMTTVEVFDLAAAKWRLMTPMNLRRQNFKLVHFSNRLWAIGYTHAYSEMYDPVVESWELAHESLVDALVDPMLVNLLQPVLPQTRIPIRVLDTVAF